MGEGGAGMGERLLAELRQRDAVPLPDQQLDAERLLQRRQGLAHAGLGNPDGLGCSGDAAGLGDSDQAAQLREFHSRSAYTISLVA